MKITTAIDTGYGYTKYCIGKNNKPPFMKNKFQTVINTFDKINNIDLKYYSKDDDIIIHYNNTYYQIGNTTSSDFFANVNTLNGEFHGSDAWKCIIFKILAKNFPKGTKKEDSLDLIIGLPLNQYQKKELIVNDLLKTIKFRDSKNKSYSFKFDNIVILPQSAGSIFTFDNKIENYEICIVDIGHFTIDVAVFEHGQYNTKLSFAVNEGTHNISTKILDLLKCDFEIQDIPKAKLESDLIRGNFTFKGKTIDLEPYKLKVGNEYANKLIELLKTRLGTMYDMINQYIVIGGGINLVFNSFKNVDIFSCETKDASFRNVLGFYNFNSIE